MPDGVTGNTSDSGSEESRFDPWSGNRKSWLRNRVFLFCTGYCQNIKTRPGGEVYPAFFGGNPWSGNRKSWLNHQDFIIYTAYCLKNNFPIRETSFADFG